MARPRRSDPAVAARYARWADQYRAGRTVTVIAREAGVSGGTIRYALLRLGVIGPYRPIDPHRVTESPAPRRTRPAADPIIAARDAAWARRHAAGETAESIAWEACMSEAGVYAALRRAGATAAPLTIGAKAVRDARWADRYRAGESCATIARGEKVSPTTVLRALRAAGVELR